MTLRWVPGWNGLTEPEAVSYVAAVEAADGQELEHGVAKAINDFVLGCKNDGIWDAIKASCILAGARTLNGALVPLVGDAPTNPGNVFVEADYNRVTGLIGDASTKHLNSNRAGNADPQNNTHLGTWITQVHDPTTTPEGTSGGIYLGNGGLSTGASNIGRLGGTTPGANFARSRSAAIDTGIGSTSPSVGFYGTARSSSASYIARTAGVNYSLSRNSETSASDNYFVFARNGGDDSPSVIANARLAFYSIGESLDLAALDTRVTRLMNLITYTQTAGLPDLSVMDMDAAAYIGGAYRAGGTLS
jgi:hypothetical protein